MECLGWWELYLGKVSSLVYLTSYNSTMELFIFSLGFTAAITMVAAIDEWFDWEKSYERAAEEQKAENFDD